MRHENASDSRVKIDPRVFLSLLLMIRNECPSLPEWLAHHRAQGVERFDIIDNNSSERCDFTRFNASGDVHIWPWTRRPSANFVGGNQMAAYNYYLPRLRTTSVWLAVWDVDEFAFGVNGSLAEVLRLVPRSVGQLCMPWLTFGSSGQQRQPSCVSASNIFRRALTKTEGTGKCIQSLAAVKSLHIHRSVLENETFMHRRADACICPDMRTPCSHAGVPPSRACSFHSRGQLSEANKARHLTRVLAAAAVRLHHYASNSHEAMARKQARGDADLFNRHRTRLYWAREEWENNKVHDPLLRDLPRVACRLLPDDPPPRPLTLNTTTGALSWDTWSSLDATAHGLGTEACGRSGCKKERNQPVVDQRANVMVEKERKMQVALWRKRDGPVDGKAAPSEAGRASF